MMILSFLVNGKVNGQNPDTLLYEKEWIEGEEVDINVQAIYWDSLGLVDFIIHYDFDTSSLLRDSTPMMIEYHQYAIDTNDYSGLLVYNSQWANPDFENWVIPIDSINWIPWYKYYAHYDDQKILIQEEDYYLEFDSSTLNYELVGQDKYVAYNGINQEYVVKYIWDTISLSPVERGWYGVSGRGENRYLISVGSGYDSSIVGIQMSDDQWVNVDSAVFSFDDQGRKVAYQEMTLDFDGESVCYGQLVKRIKEEWTYGSCDNLIENVKYESSCDLGDSWVERSRDIYEYDDCSLIKHTVYEGPLQNMVSKVEYLNTPVLKEERYFVFDYTFDIIRGLKRESRVYDELERLTSEVVYGKQQLTSNDLLSDQWENISKREIVYSDTLVYVVSEYGVNHKSGDFQLQRKGTYEFINDTIPEISNPQNVLLRMDVYEYKGANLGSVRTVYER